MFKSGYVAIIGRPNVGKSTLLNTLLGQKISITAHKPQTTRHRIIGIKNQVEEQVVYVDTPGMHLGAKRAINRHMNRAADSALHDVDIIVLLLDRTKWTDEDQLVLDKLKKQKLPVIAVINKVDKLKSKDDLLPYLQQLTEKYPFHQIIPLSAKTAEGVQILETHIRQLLPSGPPLFPEDQITDRSERFIAAELVREKLLRRLGDEVPHYLTVEIEKFSFKESVRHISALIWVEREGQKAIVIGKKGEVLKKVGEAARKDMELLFDGKVFLQLWVKVKQGWSDNERALRSLGYHDDE
ncbi:MAG: GTPase Era [Gammaproteobacteria bacterium]|nr:GTPase Era [Gammaproteobacteria bacterium]MDH5801037.1 GTPase Era [Gammaproteobacteria bacterium]